MPQNTMLNSPRLAQHKDLTVSSKVTTITSFNSKGTTRDFLEVANIWKYCLKEEIIIESYSYTIERINLSFIKYLRKDRLPH